MKKNVLWVIGLFLLGQGIVYSQAPNPQWPKVLVTSDNDVNLSDVKIVLYGENNFNKKLREIKLVDGARVDLTQARCLKKKTKSFILYAPKHVSVMMFKSRNNSTRISNWSGYDSNPHEVDTWELKIYQLNEEITSFYFLVDGKIPLQYNRLQSPSRCDSD